MSTTWRYQIDLMDEEGNTYKHRSVTEIPMPSEEAFTKLRDGIEQLFNEIDLEVLTFQVIEENPVQKDVSPKLAAARKARAAASYWVRGLSERGINEKKFLRLAVIPHRPAECPHPDVRCDLMTPE